MKKNTLFDILFMVISGIVLVLINYFGSKGIFSDNIFLFTMVSYFIGKEAGKIIQKEKVNSQTQSIHSKTDS